MIYKYTRLYSINNNLFLVEIDQFNIYNIERKLSMDICNYTKKFDCSKLPKTKFFKRRGKSQNSKPKRDKILGAQIDEAD